MKRTYIKDIKKEGKVLIKGWISTIRDQGGIIFLIIRDISGTVQAVVTKTNKDTFARVKKLTSESVVEIIGEVKQNKSASNGIEVVVAELEVLSLADPLLPILVTEKGEQETSRDIRLDWRWLDLRKEKNALIFKVWTEMELAFINYCVKNNFIRIHSPKTLITSTESGSELFEIKYFKKKAFLAQSPQLYKQMAMASGFEKVFEIGPVFRANPSFTSRHDTEFTMYDVEMSYIDSHMDLMAEEENMMIAMFQAVKDKYGEEIKKTFRVDVVVPKRPFPKVTFIEAKKILKSLNVKSSQGDDFSPEEERAFGEYVSKKYKHQFVFVYDFYTSARAFYAMRHEHDQKLSKSFDLLFKGLEITSGAQREHRPDKLKQQIIDKGFNPEPFKSYLDFFKYGCPPHGGFAPGPSRILMKMLGLDNVREVTYIYRGVNRLTP